MSYKTNARMTVPLVGGGSLTFAKRDLISFAKYEGDNAILLHKYKKPVKIRLTDEEFFDDFYTSRTL
jgi:hypothetical protein